MRFCCVSCLLLFWVAFPAPTLSILNIQDGVHFHKGLVHWTSCSREYQHWIAASGGAAQAVVGLVQAGNQIMRPNADKAISSLEFFWSTSLYSRDAVRQEKAKIEASAVTENNAYNIRKQFLANSVAAIQDATLVRTTSSSALTKLRTSFRVCKVVYSPWTLKIKISATETVNFEVCDFR